MKSVGVLVNILVTTCLVFGKENSQCSNTDLVNNVGEIYYRPTASNGSKQLECIWSFRDHKAEFILLITVDFLADYGIYDTITAPDGKRLSSQTITANNERICLKYTMPNNKKELCLSSLNDKYCPEQMHPFPLDSNKPLQLSITTTSSLPTNFQMSYLFLSCSVTVAGRTGGFEERKEAAETGVGLLIGLCLTLATLFAVTGVLAKVHRKMRINERTFSDPILEKGNRMHRWNRTGSTVITSFRNLQPLIMNESENESSNASDTSLSVDSVEQLLYQEKFQDNVRRYSEELPGQSKEIYPPRLQIKSDSDASSIGESTCTETETTCTETEESESSITEKISPLRHTKPIGANGTLGAIRKDDQQYKTNQSVYLPPGFDSIDNDENYRRFLSSNYAHSSGTDTFSLSEKPIPLEKKDAQLKKPNGHLKKKEISDKLSQDAAQQPKSLPPTQTICEHAIALNKLSKEELEDSLMKKCCILKIAEKLPQKAIEKDDLKRELLPAVTTSSVDASTVDSASSNSTTLSLSNMISQSLGSLTKPNFKSIFRSPSFSERRASSPDMTSVVTPPEEKDQSKERELYALQLLYTTEPVEDVRSRTPSPVSSDSSKRSVKIRTRRNNDNTRGRIITARGMKHSNSGSSRSGLRISWKDQIGHADDSRRSSASEDRHFAQEIDHIQVKEIKFKSPDDTKAETDANMQDEAELNPIIPTQVRKPSKQDIKLEEMKILQFTKENQDMENSLPPISKDKESKKYNSDKDEVHGHVHDDNGEIKKRKKKKRSKSKTAEEIYLELSKDEALNNTSKEKARDEPLAAITSSLFQKLKDIGQKQLTNATEVIEEINKLSQHVSSSNTSDAGQEAQVLAPTPHDEQRKEFGIPFQHIAKPEDNSGFQEVLAPTPHDEQKKKFGIPLQHIENPEYNSGYEESLDPTPYDEQRKDIYEFGIPLQHYEYPEDSSGFQETSNALGQFVDVLGTAADSVVDKAVSAAQDIDQIDLPSASTVAKVLPTLDKIDNMWGNTAEAVIPDASLLNHIGSKIDQIGSMLDQIDSKLGKTIEATIPNAALPTLDKIDNMWGNTAEAVIPDAALPMLDKIGSKLGKTIEATIPNAALPTLDKIDNMWGNTAEAVIPDAALPMLDKIGSTLGNTLEAANPNDVLLSLDNIYNTIGGAKKAIIPDEVTEEPINQDETSKKKKKKKKSTTSTPLVDEDIAPQTTSMDSEPTNNSIVTEEPINQDETPKKKKKKKKSTTSNNDDDAAIVPPHLNAEESHPETSDPPAKKKKKKKKSKVSDLALLEEGKED